MERYRRKLFPLLAGLLWAAFLFLDITAMANTTPLKFLSICLCAVTAVIGANNRDSLLVAAAQCLTVCADWFLLVRNDHYAAGVTLFLAVQALYACRLLLLRDGRPSAWGLATRGLMLLLCVGGWFFSSPLGLTGVGLVWLPLFYFSNLCVNAAESFALREKVFAWGLVLFICCDVCVGLWNLSLFLPALAEFARVGMWLFYLPSQVLIVLSAHRKEKPA